MAIKTIKVLRFDNGEEVELPKEIRLDPDKLSKNPVLNIAQIFVRELQALGIKCSWRRSAKKVEKKAAKEKKPSKKNEEKVS